MQIATFLILHGDTVAQAELNAFLRGHRILQVDKSFTGSGWSFCVEWLEGKSSGETEWKAKRIDYREVLDAESFARFAKLRERRKAIALEDGVPTYMVMTDAQLAKVAKAEKMDMTLLKQIDGFGEAHVKKYGERLLGIIDNQANEAVKPCDSGRGRSPSAPRSET